MSEGRLLVVEDDAQMQQLLRYQLTAYGYQVDVIEDGLQALEAIGNDEPDLVLLDIGLPGMDGLDVCRELRKWSSVPVILVTAADKPQTIVTALELGADDYLTKPFHAGELVARIRAVLRRVAAGSGPVQTTVEVGDLKIDLANREVWRGDAEVALTRTEFDLLSELVSHPDRVLTYRYLLESVWGHGYDDIRPVHVHICNLRRKLEVGPTSRRRILTVPGVGYRFRLYD